MDGIYRYVKEIKDTLDRLPWQAIQEVVAVLHEARLNDRQVFIVANGGSAATASHFACDLGKGTLMPGRPASGRLPSPTTCPSFRRWPTVSATTGYSSGNHMVHQAKR